MIRRLLAMCAAAALLAAGCSSGSAPEPSPSRAAPPFRASPTPPLSREDRLAFSENPNSPLLVVYCAAQDRIVTLEGQVLEGHLSRGTAAAKMRIAQRIAQAQVANFERGHRPDIARLARSWAASFDRVVLRIERGHRPIDALHPAIQGLGRIERRFTCELDA